LLFDLTLAVTIIDCVCVQVMHKSVEDLSILAIQQQVSIISSHDTAWGDEKDGENDLALLSPCTASCLALVRGSLLQDYK
jgi:hypothetical protein